MVIIETSFSQLYKYTEKKFSAEELETILFNMGFELESIEGDEIKIDVTAERPDLLSTQGLARALRCYLRLKTENYKIQKSNYKIKIVNPAKEWSHAVAAVVKGLKFDDKKIKEIIRIQEKLHITFLRNRKKGGLGVYPLNKVKFPIIFGADDPKKIKFRPLEYPDDINGFEVLKKHPTGQKYKDLIENWKKYPFFRDSNSNILSMPPIINSHDTGKIDENTTEVFVEATGIDFKTINLALEILVGALIDMGGKAYSVEIIEGKNKFFTPQFNEEKRKIKVEYVNSILGTEFKAKDIKKYLEKIGYNIESFNEKVLNIIIPGTRYDIWHDIDVVDDAARGYGFDNFELRMKPVCTIGDTTPSVKIKDELSKLIIGLGYQEVFTLILSSREDQFKNMNLNEYNCIKLGASSEHSIDMARVWLLPELMKCLKNNRSAEYPQKIFEINYVIEPDNNSDVLSKDILKLAISSSHSGANFTEIKQVLDYLMNAFNLKYNIKDSEHSSFISGRCGAVSINNKEIGFIGEIHPQVLENFGLIMPAVGLELDLSKMFDL